MMLPFRRHTHFIKEKKTMITNRMTKQMIDLQKSTFDMMLNTMSNFQEKSGRATQAYFEQMANLPQENLKPMRHWMDSMSAIHNEFKAVIHGGFDSFGDVFDQTMRQTEKTVRNAQQSARQPLKQEGSSEQRVDENSQTPSENDLRKLKEQLEEQSPP
jgi:hypothetical protein